jgi:Gas vesicle protein K/Gas vesicle protein
MRQQRLALDDGSLVDVLDRLLDVGAYVDGTVLLTLADVDLVRLDLRLLLASIETLRVDDTPPDQTVTATAPERVAMATSAEPLGPGRAAPAVRVEAECDVPLSAGPDTTPRVRNASDLAPRPQGITDEDDWSGDEDNWSGDESWKGEHDWAGGAEPDRHAGIAGLVVVLVDIVRKLLERQAIRRMDTGTLTGTEVERLGQALMALEQQTAELTEFVGAHRHHNLPSLPSGARPHHIPAPRQQPAPNQKPAPNETPEENQRGGQR